MNRCQICGSKLIHKGNFVSMCENPRCAAYMVNDGARERIDDAMNSLADEVRKETIEERVK